MRWSIFQILSESSVHSLHGHGSHRQNCIGGHKTNPLEPWLWWKPLAILVKWYTKLADLLQMALPALPFASWFRIELALAPRIFIGIASLLLWFSFYVVLPWVTFWLSFIFGKEMPTGTVLQFFPLWGTVLQFFPLWTVMWVKCFVHSKYHQFVDWQPPLPSSPYKNYQNYIDYGPITPRSLVPRKRAGPSSPLAAFNTLITITVTSSTLTRATILSGSQSPCPTKIFYPRCLFRTLPIQPHVFRVLLQQLPIQWPHLQCSATAKSVPPSAQLFKNRGTVF